ALETRVAVGKQRPDVTTAGRTEQGIDERMARHVTVRVAFETEVPGQRDTSEHQRRSGHETMDVVAVAHAQARRVRLTIGGTHAIARSRSASSTARSSG